MNKNNQQVAREIYVAIGGKTKGRGSVGVIKRVLDKHYKDTPTWINVKDGLPPQQKHVVLLREGGILGFGYKESNDPDSHLWADVTRRDRDGDWADVFDVTHWYPIPKVV